MQKLIEISDISFRYANNDQNVLNKVTLTVGQGEFVAIIGANGSGKTTLAKHMNAILLPSEGRVTVNGMDTADESMVYQIRSTVGMVFQNPDNQIVASIVEEDVAFALENLGVERSEIRLRVDETLETVGMTKYQHSSPMKLSGGQKQRVAIAGVLAMNPDCLVLDEPTAMLDPVGRDRVIRTICQLNKECGITVVLITHFMEDAALADTVVVMNQGAIDRVGPPKEIFADMDGLKAIGLGVPGTAELCAALRRNNIDIADNLVSLSECITALAELLEAAR